MESLDFSNVFVWRAVERLLGLIIGGVTIYLGYRLFMSLPHRSSDSEGKFELPGGISIYISRVGPGVFFALFGAAVVSLSFVNALTYKAEAGTKPTQSAMATGSLKTSDFSYVSGNTKSSPIHLSRDAVVRDVRTLRKLEMHLEGSTDGRIVLAAPDADALLIALPRVKRMMLRGVWDPQWGNYDSFSQWVRDGMTGSAPQDLNEEIRKLF